MKNKTALSFDDITLLPADFSTVRSRADVNTSQELCGYKFNIPIISSNMDAVYSPRLASLVALNGGISCVPRFCSIDTNLKLFKDGTYLDKKPWVSVGIGNKEIDRAEALVCAGAEVIVIDVAHGAAIHVAEQFKTLKVLLKDNIKFVVGNFATGSQIDSFIHHSGLIPDAFKVNIGSGSACTTRVVTGVGLPSVASLESCVATGYPIIQDGGIKNSGDFCKALALGAKAVFVGKLFAACQESGADCPIVDGYYDNNYKIYRGSASLNSYKSQGKISDHRTPEGEEFIIPVSGTVQQFMQQFEAGLRSSMSYLGANNLQEFHEYCEYVTISNNGNNESKAHGKII